MSLELYNYDYRKGTPRPRATYRAARRNEARGHVWRGARVLKYVRDVTTVRK